MTARPTSRTRGLAALAAVLGGLTLVSCASTGSQRTVTVLGTWTDHEERSFREVVSAFEKQTGITVNYTGNRDADKVLASELSNGSPPDLAVFATPGRLRQFARKGILLPLDQALDDGQMRAEYPPQWRELMRLGGPSGTPGYYAIVVKATAKSLIWYDPARLPERQRRVLSAAHLTWQGLTSITHSLAASGVAPWCMGLEDSSNSGWPATDWIEDIVLHQSGPKVYDQWIAGGLRWSSFPIVRAWQTWGGLVHSAGMVHGDTMARLLTNYGAAGRPMFANPPGCFLEHAGSFITQFYRQDPLPTQGTSAQRGQPKHPQPDTDFDFVPFPGNKGGQPAQEVAGDLLGMFRDTPEARMLIKYLTTAQAQRSMVKQFGPGAISVNQQVPLDAYPNELSRRLAHTILAPGPVRFDASDSMPLAMSQAFNYAVLEYLTDPGRLSAILTRLDEVRTAER